MPGARGATTHKEECREEVKGDRKRRLVDDGRREWHQVLANNAEDTDKEDEQDSHNDDVQASVRLEVLPKFATRWAMKRGPTIVP